MRLAPPAVSFWSALVGIAMNGSPWGYMLTLRSQGFDSVVQVPLGPAGDYIFLQSADTVKQVCVDDASNFPRRYSVPLFNTLQLDRGIVYEQGERHREQKRLCIPAFEAGESMESFLEAVKEETADAAERWNRLPSNVPLDLYAEARRLTPAVVLRVTFGLGAQGAREYENAALLSETIGSYLEAIVATANEVPPLWQVSPESEGLAWLDQRRSTGGVA